jgi:hypothetical protein
MTRQVNEKYALQARARIIPAWPISNKRSSLQDMIPGTMIVHIY